MENSIPKDTALLQVQDLSKFFGGLGAVIDLNMIVKRNEILALIGPNGAGKTTVFNLITGFLRPTKGKLFFKNENIGNLPPHQVARKGIVRSFQANILFLDKTVRENVQIALYPKYKNRFFSEIITTKSYTEECAEIEVKIEETLNFLNLIGLKDQLAKNLTHGYQRMLGVAVALAAGPDLLLLDEPVTGMNDEETAGMMELIKRVRDKGVTILLIEHDMKAVMGNCDRIVVLESGRKIAEGTPSEIANNHRVIEAYLGTEEFDAA